LAGGALGATQGALYGAGTAKEGEKAEAAKLGAGVGGGVGAVFPMLPAALGRVISPKASTNPAVQKLMAEGVKPTIGQALGGRISALEEKAMSLPIMGDMISLARSKAGEGVQAAAFNRALAPIGQSLPKGLKGRDAVVHTADTLQKQYDTVLAKIGAIAPDEQFSTKVNELSAMVDKLKVPAADKQKYTMALDDVISSIDENGYLTSDAYKTLESSLGQDFRNLTSSQSVTESRIAPAVKQLQQNLRDMLKRQAGDSADELQRTNEAWANFKRVQGAAAKSGAIDGEFTPAQLAASVRALDKSKDKGASAKGQALMQDLSDAARSVVGSKVPDSGTAGRLFYGGSALAAGTVAPAIPLSLAAGGAMYTPAIQNALVKAVAKRGANAPKIAKQVNALMLKGDQPASAMAARLSNNGQ
jgi:hypothetical protein